MGNSTSKEWPTNSIIKLLLWLQLCSKTFMSRERIVKTMSQALPKTQILKTQRGISMICSLTKRSHRLISKMLMAVLKPNKLIKQKVVRYGKNQVDLR